VESVNLLKKIKHLLRFYDFSPKRHLGQNFTVSSQILQLLTKSASLTKDDVVLEIGAGFGFLTRLLSRECKKVIAVEIDHQLVDYLKKQFTSIDNVVLIEGDILNVSLPSFNKIVSAPPYSISSPLLFQLLEKKFDFGIFILQKEFAERLAAEVGTKDYGRLTVMINYRATVDLLNIVSRKMFYPPPDVDSMLLCLKPRDPPFHVENESIFFDIVRTLFTQRNKKVRNGLIQFLRKHDITKQEAIKLADSTIYSMRRVRELSPEDFGFLANEFTNIIQ
jgi:16S rRNA (adenine1518-N6/adenine1519-N6)-dimethyltransferase